MQRAQMHAVAVFLGIVVGNWLRRGIPSGVIICQAESRAAVSGELLHRWSSTQL